MKEKLEHLWSILTRTELWIAVGVIVAALIEIETFPVDSTIGKLLALGAAVLTALGYMGARTLRKVGRDKAKATAMAAAIGEGAKPDPT